MSEEKSVNPNAVYLGRAIACTRMEHGMKRKDLVVATGSGISYPFLAEIENGKKWPSFRVLDVLAEALGCSSLYLLGRAKQIGDDYPLPCEIALQHPEGCICWEVALAQTDFRRGGRGVAKNNTEFTWQIPEGAEAEMRAVIAARRKSEAEAEAKVQAEAEAKFHKAVVEAQRDADCFECGTRHPATRQCWEVTP
jgi:transcriptional regulator with XRE-family HTH domain